MLPATLTPLSAGSPQASEYSTGMWPAHGGGPESLSPHRAFCNVAYQSCPEDTDVSNLSPFNQVPQCIAFPPSEK